MTQSFVLHTPGLFSYDRALELQSRLWREVRADPSVAHLILLEHTPVYTLGKFADPSHLPGWMGTNVFRDIPVVRTDRGGEVTYHGPGQLVGYPILSLRERGWGVRTYVRRLENWLAAALEALGVEASTKTGCVGVWAAGGKIGSIGVRVAGGVTRHGFALNVRGDLTPFGWIHPCGQKGGAVTSIEREIGCRVEMGDVIEVIRKSADKAITGGI